MKTFLLLATVLAGAAISASPAAAQPGAADRFAEADANGDGAVTRVEFEAARMARFSRLDRNGDGAIGRDDFGRLLRFRQQAGQRLDEMLAEADANHDGRVTRAELQQAPTPLFDRADANGDGRVDASEREAARDQVREDRR
jgi:hypothetical protein